MVLGGEKLSIQKPRVRSLEGGELSLSTLALFQDEEPLSRAVLSRLLCGVSTRKYEKTLDISTEERSCTSKSEASRRFVAGLESLMEEFFARPITNDYPTIMLDGLSVGDMMVIAAMGITSDGHKQILGLIEGATENHAVINSLLSDLINRGLSIETPRLFVLDGGKGLHKAVRTPLADIRLYSAARFIKSIKFLNIRGFLPPAHFLSLALTILLSLLYVLFGDTLRT